MSGWTPTDYALVAITGLAVLYAFARLVISAYFDAKLTYATAYLEMQKEHMSELGMFNTETVDAEGQEEV